MPLTPTGESAERPARESVAHARYLIGDVFDRMAELPDGSVDLVLTSPPFLALRSYLPADHPDKAKEIGSEPTPAAFLDTLLALTAEWRRLLAPHGSICVELGDTYSGSGGAGGDYTAGGIRDGQERFNGAAAKARAHATKTRRKDNDYPNRDDVPRPARNGRRNRPADEAAGILTPRGRPGPEGRDQMAGWPMDKSLCGIPHLYHLSLAYGVNLLTGEPSPAGRWRVRNVVAWCRPNPPVGALGDKFRPGTSYMTIATVARDRYFDLDAVRTEAPRTDNKRTLSTQYQAPGQPERKTRASAEDGARIYANPGGAPPLDWWEIPTQPYPGSHYATWPAALCERPIKTMAPQRVCVTCGRPSRRIVGEAEYHQSPNAHGSGRAADDVAARTWESGIAKGKNQSADLRDGGVVRVAPTLGWTDCGHGSWRNGLVLDPFAGSGTTLAVATGHGRDCIGIDLDARNADLARERVGMFLDIEAPHSEAIA